DGWDPPPFIPWHQPFFNEAGWYTAHITLPADQHLASTGSAASVRDLGNGWKQVDIAPVCARDFALLCGARFVEYTAQSGPLRGWARRARDHPTRRGLDGRVSGHLLRPPPEGPQVRQEQRAAQPAARPEVAAEHPPRGLPPLRHAGHDGPRGADRHRPGNTEV